MLSDFYPSHQATGLCSAARYRPPLQEGSINGYSDPESSHVADELMALAEPDHRASLAAFPHEGSGGGAADKQGSSAGG